VVNIRNNGIKIVNNYASNQYKTISTKVIEIDIEKNPSIMFRFGDYFAFQFFRTYPNISGQKEKRQRERRIANGQCSFFGCPNRAEVRYLMCRQHRKLNNLKAKDRMRRLRGK
jgi:hypothetical protein